MKNILVGFIALTVLNACNSIDENLDKEGQAKVEEAKIEMDKEDTYRKFVLKNRIETIKASAFQYKFGEPVEQGILVYETKYDYKGNILKASPPKPFYEVGGTGREEWKPYLFKNSSF